MCGSLANIDYLKMAKKYGIKRRIIHSHNSQNMDSRLRGILHKYNKKRIAYYVTDFWSCSKEASEWFYDSSIIKKSIIISNAIDVEKYCFDDVKRKKLRRDLKWEENYIIGNIGRLHFQKNQMFILDIFEKLIKKEPKSNQKYKNKKETDQKPHHQMQLLICQLIFFLGKILLFSQTKFLDQSTVSLDIYFLEVCKKSSSLSNHLKKSSS